MLLLIRAITLLNIEIFAQVDTATCSLIARVTSMAPILVVVSHEARVRYGGLTRRLGTTMGILLLLVGMRGL